MCPPSNRLKFRPAPPINVDCGTEFGKTCYYPATYNIEWCGEGEDEERVAAFKAIKLKSGCFVHSCPNELFYDCRDRVSMNVF